MRAIIPKDITLVSTSVAANTEDEWSATTLYDAEDTVQVTSSFPNKVYRSLVDNNYGRSPADHLEGVVETATSTTSVTVETGVKTFTVETHKGFTAGMLIKITHATRPRSINMTAEVVSYNESTGSLEVSIYQSTGSGTVATWDISSDEEIIFWEEVGATNQHKMFDEYFNTATEDNATVTVKIDADLCDCVALLGLECQEVQLRLINDADTIEYYSETIDMVYGRTDSGSSASWWEWFFGEFSLKSVCNVRFGVAAADAVLEITLVPLSGGTAKCAVVCIGRDFYVGQLQFGGSAEIISYASSTTDDDGRTKLAPGNKATLNDYSVVIQNHRKDIVFNKMKELLEVATVYSATDDDEVETFVTFGVYREFSLTWSGPVKSYCSFEINGLI